MKKITVVLQLLVALAFTLLAGCGGGSSPIQPLCLVPTNSI